MELRLGATLILDESEVDRLVDELPDGWSDPFYDALVRGTAREPWEVRTLFDIRLRDALDDAVAESWIPSPSQPEMPVGENYEVIESALKRIWSAYPETDVTVGNMDDGPLPSGWEIDLSERDGPDEHGCIRIADKLSAASLWAQTLATKPAISASDARAVWLTPEAAIASGDPSGIPDASADVALANVLLLLRDVFELTYPVREPHEDGTDGEKAAHAEEPSTDA